MLIREQLRPYIQQQFRAIRDMGTPLMRPLFYDFGADPTAAAIDDQMMFGPRYMLAPQLRKESDGGTTRSIYLPALPQGEVWRYWFNDGVVYHGGRTIVMDTPLASGEFPLFERSLASSYEYV